MFIFRVNPNLWNTTIVTVLLPVAQYLNVSGNPYHMCLDSTDSYLYVAFVNYGLRILNVTDKSTWTNTSTPVTLSLLNQYPFNCNRDVNVIETNQFAIISSSDPSNGLNVLNVSNISTNPLPKVAYFNSTNNWFYRIALSKANGNTTNNYAAITYTNGSIIIN